MLTDLDKKVIAAIQQSMPITERHALQDGGDDFFIEVGEHSGIVLGV